MKVLHLFAGAQGVSVDLSPIARFFSSTLKSLGLLLACIGLSSAIYGQNLDTLSVDPYGLSIVTVSKSLEMGEAVEVLICLGDTSNYVENAAAFEVTFTVAPEALFPSQPTLDLSQSWLLDGVGQSTLVEADSTASTLKISGGRTDGKFRTGDGELFRFTLVAADSGVWAGDLLSEVAGGFVVVENVMMKKGVKAEEEMRYYPNPCRSTLQIDWKGATPESISLWDLHGRQVLNLDAATIASGKLNVEQLRPGIYLLRVLQEGKLRQARIRVLGDR